MPATDCAISDDLLDALPDVGISREYQRAVIDLIHDLLREERLDPDVGICALWLIWKLTGRHPAAANVRAINAA